MAIEQELAGMTPQEETFLTIGVFDGVHAGHRYLLEGLKQRATEIGLHGGVVTFDPHPQSALHPDRQLPSLISLEDRVKTLQQLGVDTVAVLTFTHKVAILSARDFMSLLRKHLKMQGLMVGPDFALGRGGEGNLDVLRTLGYEMKFRVEVVPPYTIDGEVVSSTLIRQALTLGDMRKTARLMGRYFYLTGKVIMSNRRGRTLGFPTANLDTRPQQALPGRGVYATVTHVDGEQFPSVTNIGTRPTFGEEKKLVETHLLSYKGDLYDREIRVEFVQKIRDERCFPSSKELKTQIEKDVQEVQALLAKDLK